jgi:hypothetical protein
MARLQSGVSPFTTGQTLTASDLNNHVTGASPLPDFIGLQTALTTPVTGDEFLVNDIDGGAVKKVTLANIASNMPDTTVASLTVTTNATVTGNATVDGNTTIGSNSSDTLTVNATPSFGAAATFNGNVTANANVTLGSDNADTVTLNGTLAGTIQGTPTVSLTSVSDAYGDKVLIQDASDSNKLKVVAACLPKAWACISTKTADTTTVSITNGGVRSASSNVLTITYAGHGFKVGDVIYLNLNGTAEDGWYDIKTVPDANTFTVQTAATTALTTNVSWYALTINGFGISSAFKESTGSNIVNVNFTVPFTSVNYAPQIGFINQAASTAGTYVCVAGIINDPGLGSFNKTVNNFGVKITPAYLNGSENEGQLTLSVFGNI